MDLLLGFEKSVDVGRVKHLLGLVLDSGNHLF